MLLRCSAEPSYLLNLATPYARGALDRQPVRTSVVQYGINEREMPESVAQVLIPTAA